MAPPAFRCSECRMSTKKATPDSYSVRACCGFRFSIQPFASAVRQKLGHTGLSEYVGNMPNQARYRRDSDLSLRRPIRRR